MTKQRKVYAPFSLTSEAGVGQTPVEGYIDVSQDIQPILTTGSVNENGKWIGVKSSDDNFIGISKALSVANGGTVLFPDTTSHPFIDMSDFTNLFFAIKPGNTGNFAFRAVMGPDTEPFANLNPVNAAADLRVCVASTTMSDAFVDTETCTANVWNIFYIGDRLAGQKNLQFRVTNNIGGATNIEFAFMRLL